MVKSNKLHLLGFGLVFLGLLTLAFYQLFVTPKFTRVPFKQFLKLSTFSRLFYQNPDIGQPQNFPDNNPLTLSCQPNCVFKLNDQVIKPFFDNDPEAKITSLKLKFFDPSPGLIGYQNQDSANPSFYVLSLDEKLLQTIRLNLNQHRLLEFINYYPETDEILFKSTHQANQLEEYWLYKAIEPSLRQINL